MVSPKLLATGSGELQIEQACLTAAAIAVRRLRGLVSRLLIGRGQHRFLREDRL
jgi:hypothetical protein